MNIFILDNNPKIAAQYHNDNHCSKMILETAQLLSTCCNIVSGEKIAPYKSNHINHPCSIWVRESLSNYLWLCELGVELGIEKIHRTKSGHASLEVIKWCFDNTPNIPKLGLTKFVITIPDDCRVLNPSNGEYNIVESYRNYYIKHKQHLAKWSNRDAPSWYKF